MNQHFCKATHFHLYNSTQVSQEREKKERKIKIQEENHPNKSINDCIQETIYPASIMYEPYNYPFLM